MRERGDGWIVFASAALIFAGAMRIIDAIWAFTYKGALPERLQDALLGSNLKNYGWWWLIVGIILIGAGIGVLSGNQFSRWIGIIGAAVAAFSAMAWMPYYPIWSLVYVAIAFFVLYGLAVYGGRPEYEQVP
jgi:hypothetical protein